MKIAIAGFGIEGESNYRYFAEDPSNDITIVDQSYPTGNVPKGVKTILGEDAFNNLIGFDKVIRTPSLNPNKIHTDGKIWSATNEFFANCPAPIIGVTGTKGKGTVSSLVTSILQKAGHKVWLIGNIGIPALEVLSDIQPGDIVVYELSSFQLWDIEFSPSTAVVLFMEPEHLNIHNGVGDYYQAKMNLIRHQKESDQLVYFKDNPHIDLSLSPAEKLPFQDDKFAHVKDGNFYFGDQLIGPTNKMQLLGEHNLDNACAAINVVWRYTNDTSVIIDGLTSFEGLPHRLKKIKTVDGVHYYDDSIATTPSATIAAMNAIKGPKHLILGGTSKGVKFDVLAQHIKQNDIKSAILMGKVAKELAQALTNAGVTNYRVYEGSVDIKEIVKKIHSQAQKGDSVLLSPATSSVGLYKSYIDRGNQFIQAVEECSR